MKPCSFLLFVLIPSVMFSLGCSKDEAAESPVLSQAVSPVLAQGEVVFKGTCKVCHAQGINGAPILGNANMWQERVKQGIPTLVEHASNGYGLMPAKGGNIELTTEEITAAVTYMVEQL